MKKTIILIAVILLVCFCAGCGAKRAAIQPGAGGDIAIVVVDQGPSTLNAAQQRELTRTNTWMKRDIVKQLSRAGFKATLINSKKEFSGSGYLLVIETAKFNAGSRAARAFVGYGAGSASLDLKYKLMGSNRAVIQAWQDGVGSSKGPNYCAQTLDRRAAAKVAKLVNSK